MATKTTERNPSESPQRQLSFEDTSDFSVTDEVWQKSQAVNDDGTMTVGIYDFEVNRRQTDAHDQVVVKFRTPSLEEKKEVMKWPRVPDERYEFIRLLHSIGLEFNGVEHLRTGEPEQARADPDDWSLSIPDKQEPVWKRLYDRLDVPVSERKRASEWLYTIYAASWMIAGIGLVLFTSFGGVVTGALFWSGLICVVISYLFGTIVNSGGF